MAEEEGKERDGNDMRDSGDRAKFIDMPGAQGSHDALATQGGSAID